MNAIPISQVRGFGDLVFTSGQLGVEADGTIAPDFSRQMELAMESLKTQLESAGSSLDCVLKVVVFLVNRDDFEQMNAIYGRYFPNLFPARSTIITELALPELLFEVEVVAHLAGSESAG